MLEAEMGKGVEQRFPCRSMHVLVQDKHVRTESFDGLNKAMPDRPLLSLMGKVPRDQLHGRSFASKLVSPSTAATCGLRAAPMASAASGILNAFLHERRLGRAGEFLLGALRATDP